MNNVAAGSPSSVQTARMTADVRDLVRDPQISVSAVVSTSSSSGVDPASGSVVAVDTQDTVTAYLSDVDFREAAADPRVQVGDRMLTVLASDLSVVPTTSSAVRVGSVRHAVVRVQADPLGIYYDLVLRRTG